MKRPYPVCNHETEIFYGGERGESGPFRLCLSDDCGWNEEEAEARTYRTGSIHGGTVGCRAAPMR